MSEVVSLPHRQAAADVRRVMANLAEAEELQTFGAYRRGEVPRFDLAMDFAVPLRTYLRQMADEGADFDVSRQAILKMGEALRASEQELGL